MDFVTRCLSFRGSEHLYLPRTSYHSVLKR
jgi:hypothetical protein